MRIPGWPCSRYYWQSDSPIEIGVQVLQGDDRVFVDARNDATFTAVEGISVHGDLTMEGSVELNSGAGIIITSDGQITATGELWLNSTGPLLLDGSINAANCVCPPYDSRLPGIDCPTGCIP